MGNKETVYSRINEAEEIIQKLSEKYPDVLWAVRPNIIMVLGIENKKRGKKNKTLAKIKPIKGPEKAVMQFNNVSTRYIMELYWSDWNEWDVKFKQWLILHELLHIAPDIGKTIDHDCKDFRLIIDAIGTDWSINPSTLPNLLSSDVKFNLELRPGLPEDAIETDEIMDEKEDIIPIENNVTFDE